MPSSRLTKTNIDKDLLAAMQTVAAAEGITTTVLFEKMYLNYIRSNGIQEN